MFLKIKKIAFIISLLAFLAGIIPCMASAGNCFSTSNPYYTLGSNSIEINRLTPIEIKELIDEEKNECINRAPDIFEFDNTLMGKVDHKFLLISLIKLNYLFDKYEDFTTNFINYKRALNTKFRLQFADDRAAVMSTNLNHLNFCTDTTTILSCRQDFGYSCKSGFNPPIDRGHELEYYITHEFGHLIEVLYTITPYLQYKTMDTIFADIYQITEQLHQKSKNITDSNFQRLLLKQFEEYVEFQTLFVKQQPIVLCNFMITAPDSIKNDILQGLEGQDRNISRYGCKDALEFFAEAFAHLECTDNPENVNEIGRRIESYIVNKMGYLPKENSKFNK